MTESFISEVIAGRSDMCAGALPRSYRQLVVPNSSRLRVLKYSEKIVATFNLDVPPTPSETKGSNFSLFPRVARSGNDRPIKREQSFRFRSINKQIDCRVGL
ncbi:hypothetical protein AVEN_118092-1 [Araneus ventricosus]|uniref:Uncharacterized protein n=1 Tax=Araneus ventricosus TaxID=182803 RepID=A0A4Y2J1J9_ARAVE|nr:hypothetical protein AVEN_118092-1 [Araneus ventricosus]